MSSVHHAGLKWQSAFRKEDVAMTQTQIATQDEWVAAGKRLREREKELMRLSDELAAERRRMPRLPFRADHEFDGPEGRRTLIDLFDGRRQLIVYSFMFDPGDEPCSGCSMFTDQVGHLAHLHARDTSIVLVSRAPVDQIESFKRRMGWTLPWYSTVGEGYNEAVGVRGGFALNVFLREGDDVYRTYSTRGRGVEPLGSVWTFLDLTPLGRQETWEDSPEGTPQTPPYEWWQFHDEYETD
jgi:predicted dithiol-disulfide oxidoreductase (DUF899 family)